MFELEENINIKILSDEFEKNSSFDILIDKEKIEYTKVYKFNTTGKHEVKFELYEDISMDYMFKGIQELKSVIMFSFHYPKIKSMISTFESCTNL